MATVTQLLLPPLLLLLLLLLQLSGFIHGQRINVNRGLQRPGLVGGRGPQRPAGPGGGVFLNPDFPKELITPGPPAVPAPPAPPLEPGNPNDFRNPAFPGSFPSNTLNPDFPGFPPLAGPAPPVVPGRPPGGSSPGFAIPGRPGQGIFGPGFPGFPAQGLPEEDEEGGDEEGEEGEGLVPAGGVQPGTLTCFSCKLDFRKAEYQWSHPCLGRHNGLNVSTDYLVVCGPKDNYCKAERTEVNGVLIYLARECTDTCHFGCRPRGFGISSEACSKCCQTPACNHMYPPSHASPGTAPSMILVAVVVVVMGVVA
ncbi:collagen alpha-2(I) chain-like [Eriocheir sinensis]|uniref:collagen alpha-2(I) chain-like n=1 Tax=Eriocheir sinensis TaxID=95602 RepID=UPI0021C9B780|nr:collagen alpha-2(I) chain-like [Eriocheir sinensis]